MTRLLFMCPLAWLNEACDFLGDLFNQPAQDQMGPNASTTGEWPATHAVGCSYFNDEQKEAIQDWFTSHENCGVQIIQPSDYPWTPAFNVWGLRVANPPL